MSRAVLSVGSNLGDRLATLQLALDQVRPWIVAVSPVYETPPWGPVPQDDYLNAILVVEDPSASARDWLSRAQAAEQLAGRVREVRWGPRTLDVDVVDVDGRHDDDPELTLPHPRAGGRAFVLLPWSVADPTATLSGRPVVDVLAELPAGERAGLRPRPELVLR